MRGIAVAAGVFSAALALGACGDDSDDASDSSPDPKTAMSDPKDTTTGGGDGGKTSIVIKDFKFDPDKLTAKVGDKITVTNEDSATHTLTAKDNSVDTGNLDKGASGTITLAKAGSIEYVCNIHDYMTGTIEVSQ